MTDVSEDLCAKPWIRHRSAESDVEFRLDVFACVCSLQRMTQTVLKVSYLGLLTALLAACAPEKPPTTPRNRYGFGGTQTLPQQPQQTASSTLPPLTGTDAAAGMTDTALVNPIPNPTPAPTPPPVSLPTPEISYGIPVPGKPGFVTSPHAPSAGFVDVRGFPPGTEVKDPYTGRIFLVP